MRITSTIKKSVPYAYASSIQSGELPTGQMMKLTAARFFTWIKDADKDGYYLDHKAGMMIINFFETCINHTQGKLAGQPFILAPFQQFCLYNVFAWKNKKTNLRRISTIYDKRAKKNGKTAEMAGLALYMMSFENESSSQVYVGATRQEQAKICWEQAKDFIDHNRSNPILRTLGFQCLQSKIEFPKLGSKMMALSKDSKTQDGISAHLSIIDEYHAHKDDTVKENLESSSVMRAQPITYHITTAGAAIGSVCFEYEMVCKDILRGIKKDDHTWIMIHDLDEDDDWENESNWYKANPLLGQGLSIKNIRSEFTKAKNQPSKVPNFKTKHLNMWVNSLETYIDDHIWMLDGNKEKVKDQDIIDNGCVLALDLSSVKDLTALSVVSHPDSNGVVHTRTIHFCPQTTIIARSKEDAVPYQSFVEQGLLIATPGSSVDYAIVEKYAREWYSFYNAEALEIDKWNANSIENNLINAGLNVRKFTQNITHFTAPTKQFETLVVNGKLRHGGNPLLRWQVGGLVAISDPNENLRLDKSRSTRRIDGLITIVMAIGGTMTPLEDNNESSYNNPENIVF
jgi:phage terminase large subunit-like protein